MELSENALRAEIQKLGVAPIDGTAPLSSCVEQLLSAFEGMRSQVATSRSKWDEMMGALSEVSEQAQSLKKQAVEAVKDSDQQDSVKEAEVSEGYSHVKEMQEMIVEALEQ